MSAGLNILITAENAQALAALNTTKAAVNGLAGTGSAGGIKDLQKGTVGLANGFRALQGTLILLGGQQFPQLTMGVMAAQQAMTGLRAMAEATKNSIAALGVASAAGLAGAWKIAEFIQENIALFKATTALDKSGKDLAETTATQMAKAYELAIKAVTEGRLKLSEEEAKFLDNLASKPTPERLKTMLAFIRERLPEGESLTESQREKMVRAEMQKLEAAREYGDTVLAYNHGALSFELQRLRVQMAYNDAVAKLNDLRARGYLDDTGLRDALQGEEMKRMQALIGIRNSEAAAIQGDWRLTDAEKYNRLSGMGVSGSELGPNPASFAEQWQAATVQIKNAFGSLAQTLTSGAFNLIQQGVSGISDALTGIIIGTKTAGQAFAQFGLQMLTSFISMVLNALIWAYLAIPVLTALGVLSGGATAQAGAPATIAAVAGAMGAVNGMVGARAAGGPVRGGSPYLVGERGPELYVPDSSGTILPAHVTEQVLRGGGSGAVGRTVTQTLHIYQDKQAWLDACRDDIEGIALDAVARNKHRFFA